MGLKPAKSVVKDSKKIQRELIKRWEELELKNITIVKDAAERGLKIAPAQVANYINKHEGMSEEQIVFLCIRYGVYIKLQIGKPTTKKGKIEVDKDGDVIYEIPPYNELECLKRLKLIGY